MDLDPRLHFVVITGIIVRRRSSGDEFEFLIVKRAAHEKAFPNKWTVPGGKLVRHEYETLPRGFRGSQNDCHGEGEVERKVQGSSRVGDYSEPRVLKEERSDDPQWYNVVEWVLRKEIAEEVALEVEKPQYLTDLTFIRPDGYPALTLSYWTWYKSGDVKLCKDLTDYAWVTVEEAKNYDLIEGIWEEIREVCEILSKNGGV